MLSLVKKQFSTSIFVEELDKTIKNKKLVGIYKKNAAKNAAVSHVFLDIRLELANQISQK